MQIDVRAQHAAQPVREQRHRAPRAGSAGPCFAGKQRSQLFAQRLGLGRIGAAGVGGRAHRAVQIALDLGFPPRAKPLGIQKIAVVQLDDQLFDVVRVRRLAESSLEFALNLRQRARAIHERCQHRRGIGQDDRAGKALRIAQGKNHLAAGLADRKTLHATQSRLLGNRHGAVLAARFVR